MADMTDIMVDVETTHTNPHLGAILQLSAIKFNYETGEVGDHFDRCPMWLPLRGWSEGTREFWSKHWNVYEKIVARSEPAEPVFHDFVDFAHEGAPDNGFRFWSKPLSFDWPFVNSHLEQLGLRMPFSFRIARDMNSFMAGMSGNAQHPEYASQNIEFKGEVHNALHDTAFQIDVLLKARQHYIATEIMTNA